QAADGGVAAPFPECRDGRFRRWRIGEPERETDGVSVLDRYAVGVRADHERRVLDGAIMEAAEHLLDLAFDLRLFLADVRNDVAENVERRYAGISGARNRLQRGSKYRPDAEPLVQGRHGDRGGRA